MTKVLSDVHDLARVLSGVRNPDSSIIGIEGHNGAGKSHLVTHLTVLMPRTVPVHTDCYLSRDADRTAGYAGSLNLSWLRKDVRQARRLADTVLVEGICLRETFRRLEFEPDRIVYCRQITEAGRVYEPAVLDDASAESDPGDWVTRESLSYHSRLDPANDANWVFEWSESQVFEDW